MIITIICVYKQSLLNFHIQKQIWRGKGSYI